MNRFAGDGKYPVLNRENLTIPIHMQLSQKRKKFSQSLAEFYKSSFNKNYFEKKDNPDRFSICEITDSENAVI